MRKGRVGVEDWLIRAVIRLSWESLTFLFAHDLTRKPVPTFRDHAQRGYNTRMNILGIETTCDETAAAVVSRSDDSRGRILSNVVLSQISEHAEFGGVVPEIAARDHVEALDRILAKEMGGVDMFIRHLDCIDSTV